MDLNESHVGKSGRWRLSRSRYDERIDEGLSDPHDDVRAERRRWKPHRDGEGNGDGERDSAAGNSAATAGNSAAATAGNSAGDPAAAAGNSAGDLAATGTAISTDDSYADGQRELY